MKTTRPNNRIDHCHDFDHTGFLLPDSDLPAARR